MPRRSTKRSRAVDQEATIVATTPIETAPRAKKMPTVEQLARDAAMALGRLRGPEAEKTPVAKRSPKERALLAKARDRRAR
jgi:hypothetical protein